MRQRFERQADRKGVRVQDRDLAIVEAVWEARYLTNMQIRNLFFKPTTYSWCKKRIRVLYDLGYLRKRPAHVNQRDIYYLGLKGKRYIIEKFDLPKAHVDAVAGVSGGQVETPMMFMQHELTISRLYVNAQLESRQLGIGLEWKNARMLELEKLGVQPDAWIQVQRGVKSKQAFLEFTAAFPTVAELRGKLAAYEELFLRSQPVQVLWFTTSPAKATRLKACIREVDWHDYFCVALIDEASHFLTRPIWWWSESSEAARWISPLEPEDQRGRGGG